MHGSRRLTLEERRRQASTLKAIRAAEQSRPVQQPTPRGARPLKWMPGVIGAIITIAAGAAILWILEASGVAITEIQFSAFREGF